jgi:hypothetical protein
MRGLRRIRSIGIAAAAATAVFSGVATAVPGHVAAAQPYQVLAGVTTVQTSTSGVATVNLPQPATFHFSKGHFGPGGTGVYGDGRIIAMVLEHNGRALARYFRLSDCGSPACSGDFSFGFSVVTARKLDPGLYHIYVATDGAPVTAVLELDGVSGTSNVTVAPSPAITVKTLAPLIPSTGVVDPGLYSASGSEDIGANGGVVFNTLLVTTTSVVGGYEGVCLGEGAPPPAYPGSCTFPPQREDIANPFLTCDPTGYCDPGQTMDLATQGLPFPIFDFDGADVLPGHANTWGQGGYLEGAMLYSSEASTGLWISFVPQEAAQVASATTSPSPTPSTSPSATPTPTPTPTPIVVPPVNLPNTGGPDSASAGAGVLAFALIGMGAALRRRIRDR